MGAHGRRVHAQRRPRLRRASARSCGRATARGWPGGCCAGSGGAGSSSSPGTSSSSCRDWTAETFEDERVHGLFAPWVLHTGLGPDAASSGFMAQVIGVAIELGGMPVPRGGGVKLVEALAGIVRDAGGACETGREVERIVVESDRATGVRTADGEVIEATRAVLANVTPQQLYGELLGGPQGQPLQEAQRFRFGRGEMQIHFALSEPPRLAGRPAPRPDGDRPPDSRPDGVSRAVNEADRGLLPAEATVVVGQPTAVDPSRAPEGSWILWIQLQEVPSRPEGRRGRRARRRRRHLDGVAARGATPTASRPGSPPTRRTSKRSILRRVAYSRRPTSRRPTRTCPAATSTRARVRSTRA